MPSYISSFPTALERLAARNLACGLNEAEARNKVLQMEICWAEHQQREIVEPAVAPCITNAVEKRRLETIKANEALMAVRRKLRAAERAAKLAARNLELESELYSRTALGRGGRELWALHSAQTWLASCERKMKGLRALEAKFAWRLEFFLGVDTFRLVA